MTDAPPERKSGWSWQERHGTTDPVHLARRRLAAALRAASERLIDTELDADALEALSLEAESLFGVLDSGPRDPSTDPAVFANRRAFFDTSPLIGQANPIAPPLHLRFEGQEVHGGGIFGRQFEGPPRHVHGGFVAAAFDEVLGMVQSVTGRGGMTGTLTVRYHRPTPLYREVTFVGRVDRVEGRKIFTSATLHDGETLCAVAEGIFITVRDGHFERLAEGGTAP